MDRANYALAQALLTQGRTVHLVAHEISDDLLCHPAVKSFLVPRPLKSTLLAERVLERMGLRVAHQVRSQFPDARVVVNGGNCAFPDINWVHAVHAAWRRFDHEAPLWFRTKGAIHKHKAIRDERRALTAAQLVIANSERTRRDLLSLGVPGHKIHTVYLGSDPAWQSPTLGARETARRNFGLPSDAIVVCFVGALGYDRNKGFDVLLQAWKSLKLPDAYLLAAGGGRGWDRWHEQARREGLSQSVRLLGFTKDVASVYAASDLLVSPVRYEAFGLNVQEAICFGLPAIVSKSAGVAELYPQSAERFLLHDANDAAELAELIATWARDKESAQRIFEPIAQRMRTRTWQIMANEIVDLVESTDKRPC
ncbi:MAG TPA: glycosyltransferase family 4 protein [Terriglobales bacterium]|nr:glycosyltransferase family 4 protein [Terriglobales bacterium]